MESEDFGEKIKFEKVFGDVDSLRHRRARFESINKSPNFIFSDPPWLARILAFTVNDQKDKVDDLVCKIQNGFRKGQIREGHIKNIEKCTNELGEMISTDPRLGDLLEMDFLTRIVQLLKRKQNPKLQSHAATILEYVVIFSRNKVGVVIQYITPIVLDLICSRVDLVRVSALWLLRNLVFKISKSSVEEALAPVISIILKASIGYGVLHAASEVLLVVCQVHPKLSHEKLKLALPALMKLTKSNVLTLLTSGCWGLARLCDGREEMIVEDGDLTCLIRRLVQIMNSTERAMIISGFHALGSIARWGSDDVIEAIIKDKGSLRILPILLEEGDMYLVKQTCWIISNITARKEKHIMAVIDCELIGPLVNVVHNFTMDDVVKEAVWALSNAMCGVGHHIEYSRCLRNSCSKLLWDRILDLFDHSDTPFILVVLEGLVNIKAAEVTWAGRKIDVVELRTIFKNIVHHSDLFTKHGILFCNDSAQEFDDRVLYKLHFTFFEVRPKEFQFEVKYDSLTKNLTTAHREFPPEIPIDCETDFDSEV